jgi:Domain of unknown function (DUF5063)
MPSIEQFAAEAATFRQGILDSKAAGSITPRTALRLVSALYVAGLDLPHPWTNSEEEAQPDDHVRDEEFWSVVELCKSLPFRYYGKVFDTTVVPAEPPVEGDVADDIADIFRDVVTGLRAFEAGRGAAAIWEWSFGFRHHWGRHATGAIGGLHGWLVENDPDSLSPSVPKDASTEGAAQQAAAADGAYHPGKALTDETRRG